MSATYISYTWSVLLGNLASEQLLVPRRVLQRNTREEGVTATYQPGRVNENSIKFS